MKKIFAIFSLVLIGLMIIFAFGCKKSDRVPNNNNNNNTDNNNSSTPKNVKVISDQTWNNNIVSFDSINKTVTFSKNINEIQTIQVGDIIVSSVGEGFLRKAKTVTAINDKVQVQTEPVYLTEVIKNGTIKFDQVLTVNNIKSIKYHYAGVKLITKSTKSALSFPLEINTVLYDADNNLSTTNDQIKLVGSFNCDWRLTGLIDVGLTAGLKEVNFSFNSNESIDLQLIAGLQYNFEKTYTLATVYFTPIVVIVGAVPVVFTPQLDIIVGVDGYANASVTSQIGQNLSFFAGIQWLKGSGWAPYSNFTKNLTFQPPQLNVNASAEAYIKPEMTLKVYAIAGPYIDAKIYGRLDADILQTPWWKFYGGIAMDAGAKLDIIDQYILECTVSDIIKYEILLAQSPLLSMATVTTSTVTTLTSTSATLGGNVTSDGNAAVTERGVCYSTTQNPTTANTKVPNGTGTGIFSSNIIGLTPNTSYYVRAYAINSQGTAYGDQLNFTTPGIVTDIDGNTYSTVIIGTQVWMAENLKTTKYNDGTAIPNVTVDSTWNALSTGAYCWYNDSTTYKATYGALYNWYAVSTGKLCPTGWHVPTDAEWTTLTTTLGGESIAGGKMKTTYGWNTFNGTNGNGSNTSGFSALPGCVRGGYGIFCDCIGYWGKWWSSTQISKDYAFPRDLFYNFDKIDRVGEYKAYGFSIRCLGD